ncbi:hypothetical protein T440DRAFT_539186 [Plenodomus tracheiphilus IPT5]|uniref:Tat pathway signal sequence n=1 Tax=Plenodomus tracheiphilus IPT5 TaxID=1408161 RepID=A0A6A7BI75_9PLEO|nr:hypothetical protein T440DRAFT_539186 [Plenodomus tracheiphilus IPT5]
MLSMFRTRPKHTRLPQRDSGSLDSDTLLPSSSSAISDGGKPEQLDRYSRDIQIAVRTLVLCTVVYVGAALWVVFSVRKTSFVADPDAFCIHHVSRYSPIVREVKPNWHTKLFNGTFLHENVYRQSAGPAVDGAWEALGLNYRSVVIRPEEAEEAGLRHDQVKVSQEYGGGFPANVEGLHHLHCLNLVRQALHWNYDYYLAKKEGPFVNSEYIVRVHTTHCLDIIRQVLMCNPDVGMLGQVWWQPDTEPEPMPFVDFNTRHRCRDFEAVRAWAEAHQLPPEKEVNMSRFYEMPKPGDMVYPEIP